MHLITVTTKSNLTNFLSRNDAKVNRIVGSGVTRVTSVGGMGKRGGSEDGGCGQSRIKSRKGDDLTTGWDQEVVKCITD